MTRCIQRQQESEPADAMALAAARLGAQRPLRKPRLQKIALHLKNNRPDVAEEELNEYLARHPDDVDAIALLARSKVRLDRYKEAVSLLVRCLEIAPDFAGARFNLAELLFRLNRFEEALHELGRLLTEDSDNPLFLLLNANVLEMIGENAQALVFREKVTNQCPGRPDVWVNYGHALRVMGFREKSIAAYRKAIECSPPFGQAWWSLANLKTVRFDDADIAAMQEQLRRPGISADDRVALQYCLGKAYEDLGAYDRSYEQYAKVNAAMRLRIDYDPDTLTSGVVNNKALFTPEFLRSRSDAGCKAPDPIFILGRPRSGSTLIEQILSSHSAIEGTAELPYITALAGRLEGRESGPEYGTRYLKVLANLEPSALAVLGEEYLESARVHRKLGRPFFIDKKPSNFSHVGMIHLILPNAKIIDARRHPVACCLSQFKNYSSKGRLRLTELGRFYRDYVELMAHFDSVLPRRIHRVIYEDMVANPEAETRRLLDYLGLPFEERCLRFYETERAVLTPSSEQVRRPISGDAVDHWRHYEPWLGPLIDSLGSVFTAYPAVPAELS